MNDGRDFDPLLLPVVVADKSDGHRGGSAGQEHDTAASAEDARHLHQTKKTQETMKGEEEMGINSRQGQDTIKAR